MTIGFYLVDIGSVDAAVGVQCAEAMVRSVRQTMPGVRVVQFTDEATAAVSGVDEVRRFQMEPMACLRIRHQGAVRGDWLFVDSDVVFQRDVRDVFQRSFDIALTTRDWTHLRPAMGFSERMPFNVGVVFSRSHKFWAEVYSRLQAMPDELQHWMGDQQAVCDLVAKSRRYRLAFVKGSVYNFPPSVRPDPAAEKMLRKAAIVHYKGVDRKALLLERVRQEAACA